MLEHQLQGILTHKGRATRSRTIHHTADGINIRTSIQVDASTLLRAHIEWAAKNLPGLGQLDGCAVLSVYRFGNTEVDDLDEIALSFILDQHNVRRLQVPVN